MRPARATMAAVAPTPMPAIVPDERRGGISPGDGGSSPELRVDAEMMEELKDEEAKPAMKLVVRGEVRVIVVEL